MRPRPRPAASRARSLRAPRFCPTNVCAALPQPIATKSAIVSRRKTRPIAVVAVWSEAVVKNRATSELTRSIAAMRTTNCALDGHAIDTRLRRTSGLRGGAARRRPPSLNRDDEKQRRPARAPPRAPRPSPTPRPASPSAGCPGRARPRWPRTAPRRRPRTEDEEHGEKQVEHVARDEQRRGRLGAPQRPLDAVSCKRKKMVPLPPTMTRR